MKRTAWPSKYIGKAVKICVCADGCVSIRSMFNQTRRLNAALPFFSTDSTGEAQSLVVLICNVAKFDHEGVWVSEYRSPILMNQDIDNMRKLTKLFVDAQKMIRKKHKEAA